ncbi:type III secretion FHIPEP protein [Gemmatirosa kalamazoonensis]|uniref:Type III secretion FHIPEP protein n=1 Tax=Gemmatirosa kalamazoonensis TaxID=861299 RepID=W0RLP4_9BACT|nr:FHIPEP family type III secretion protein [Gemmatirosa kalamazoonensis]AHG91676.1 type III secretion FHIPEP protein [Gemmatirosa kalamazoonensis]
MAELNAPLHAGLNAPPPFSIAEFDRLTAPDSDAELLERTLAVAARRHAELPAVIRLAAIPRHINARIIGILRDRPDDHSANAELFAMLAALPITRLRQDGDCALHHDARELLLRQWLEPDVDRTAFDACNLRLAAHFRSEVSAFRRLTRDLELAGAVVRQANRARYDALLRRVETLEIAPLLEEQYHDTLRSIDAGYETFRDRFQEYQREGRTTVCNALLVAMRDNLRRRPGDDDAKMSTSRWLEYWAGRLDVLQSRYGEAVRRLSDLERRVGEDVTLLLWTISSLGDAYSGLGQLDVAVEIYRRELELSTSSRVDPFNIPVSYARVASNLFLRDDLDASIDYYRQSVRSAREEANRYMEGTSLVGLAGALADRGNLSGAVASTLQALDLVWMAEEPKPDDAIAVLGALLRLVPPSDPALVDTLYHELRALVPAGADVNLRLDYDRRYMDALVSATRLRLADQTMDTLARDAAGQVSEEFLAQLQLSQGGLRSEQGNVDAAIEAYSLALAFAPPDENGVTWTGAAALSNRGLLLRERGDLDAAVHDFRVAREHWRKIGHRRLTAAMLTFEAQVLERRARLAAAARDRAHDAAGSDVETTALARAESHRLTGDVHGLHRRHAEADDEHARAIAASEEAGAAGAWIAARSWHARAAIRANDADWPRATTLIASALAACAACAASPAPARAAADSDADAADLAEAQRLLDDARTEIGADLPQRFAELRHTDALVLRRRGRIDEAFAAFTDAAASYDMLQRPRLVATVLVDRADMALAVGRAEEAARSLASLSTIWSSIAALDAYRPTSEVVAADEDDARAMRAFFTGGKERLRQLRAARDLFENANQQAPPAYWYRLNAAYTAAQLGEWDAAIDQMDALLRMAPAWMPRRTLHHRLAEWHLATAGADADATDAPTGVVAREHARRARELLDPRAEEATDVPVPPPVDAWTRVGKALATHGDVDAAREFYRRCLDTLRGAGCAARFDGGVRGLAEARARLAAGAIGADGNAPVADAFRAAMEDYVRGGAEEVGAALGSVASGMLTDVDAYWKIDEIWARLASEPGPRSAEWERARAALRPWLDARWRLDAAQGGESQVSMVTAIRVEIARDLVPEDTSSEWSLFKSLIPEMRDRIVRSTGVEVTGVRIASNDSLAPGEYRIELEEAPVARGRTGNDVPGADGEPLRPMMRHLEEVLRAQLGRFVDVGRLGGILSRWVQAGVEAHMTTSLLPDWRARARFAALLRALVDDGVPITAGREIVETVGAIGLGAGSLAPLVRAVRAALRPNLPGNEPGIRRVAVPALWEHVLAAVDERGTPAVVPPRDALAMLRVLRAAMAPITEPAVLVTRSDAARPTLRGLVRAEFPTLMVIARDELLDDAAVVDTETLQEARQHAHAR